MAESRWLRRFTAGRWTLRSSSDNIAPAANFAPRVPAMERTMTDLTIPRKTYLVLVSVTLLLIPFYFFGRDPIGQINANLSAADQPKLESGVPQLADFVMLVLIALVVLDRGFSFVPRTVPIVQIYGVFTLYIVLVNAFWSIRLGDVALLKNSLFYVFNFLVLMTFMILYSHLREVLLKCV